jgi:paxillin
MEKDGNPYCELHWHQLFGQVCAKCNRAVVGKCIRALGRSFHPEHFNCNGCNASLAQGHYEFETKALCKKCFGKLPSNVRKDIEKKRKAQLAAEKARQKAQH